MEDVCLQNLPVVFCIDRAGIVGADGETHHGIFDLSYLKHMPNLTIMAPQDGAELEAMMELAAKLDGPCAIRYPRGTAPQLGGADHAEKLEVGRAMRLREGKDAGLILFLLLGILGGGIHLMAAELWVESRKLARCVGTAYGAGILMQFINNNLVRQELVEAVILSVLLTVLAWMLSRKKESVDEEQCEASRLRAEELKNPKNPQKAAMLLVILVALMTCIFATLDNAVTMAHAEGTMDIGQWPRLLLACSGLAAGWIFDLGMLS